MMKKVLFMALVALAGLSASAQGVMFGLRGGLNISQESKLNNDPSNDRWWRTGFNAGAAVNFEIDENWEMETDLMYSMQGTKDKIVLGSESSSETSFKVTSHYLSLPVVLKFFPTQDALYLECGPQVGYLLSKKDNLKDVGSPVSLYDTPLAKKLDFGVLAGVGYRFPNYFFIEGRYVHGLTDTYKPCRGGKNRNFQLAVGYFF